MVWVMRHNQADMICATALVAILSCGATVAGWPIPITAILGFAMLASLGYVWVQVLLNLRVPHLERVATATGLTIAVPVLGGLMLQAAGVRLDRPSWACLLAGVTLIGDVVLVIRLLVARSRSDYRTAADDGPRRRSLPLWQAMAFGSAVVITIGAVGLARAGAAFQRYPGFTELWLSKRTESATTASLGVSNHQGSTKQYKLELLSKSRVSAVWYITLSNGQTWQRIVSIKVRYIETANLYLLPDLTHPYRHVDTGLF
jgi:hypothetical protein